MAQNAFHVAQNELNSRNKTPADQQSTGNIAPLQQNIDNAAQPGYTEINKELNGGTENVIRTAGLQQNESGGSFSENRSGIPGIYQYSNADNSGQRESGGVRVDSGFVLISEKALNSLLERGIVPVEAKDVSGDKAAFSTALDAARNSNPVNGWAVTPKSVEELEQSGARLLMDEQGSAGLAIATDGDIEAVFANKTAGAPKGATKSLIPMAIANGGTKLDCYGEGLVSLYAQYGFAPVARTKFDPQYANPGWDPSKGTPDIFFMMHNGDNADTVVDKFGTYPIPTKAELEALPEMDYDSAYKYRDKLLAERAAKGSPLGGAVERSETEGATAAKPTDPAEAAVEQEYRRLVENAITEGDYQRALALYREYNNPALRAYKEFYTLKTFSEYAAAQGYIPATDTALGTEEINRFEEYLRQNFTTNKLEGILPCKNDWSKTTARTISTEEKAEIMRYAKEKGVEVDDIDTFDGDPELLKAEIDTINSVFKEYGLKNTVTISSRELVDSDFAETLGHTITFNSKALRDRATTEYNICYGNYFASKTIEDIALHEMGHIVAAEYNINGLVIAKKAFYNIFNRYYSPQMLRVLLKEHVSEYSSTVCAEIIAEVIAANKNRANEFTELFVLLLKKEIRK